MLKSILYFIKSDLFRYAGEVSLKKFLKHYFLNEGFKFSVWLRICHFFRKRKLTKYSIFPFSYIMYKRYKYKFGYDIPYAIEIGPGLLLFHINGIVFSPKVAGKNVTISQCTTVGMTIKDGIKQFPIIGDNVYLAPGAKVIGGIKVGNNVAVGTNCVLNKSVENNAVVVGIPGRVISYKGADLYVNNPI
ncbi:serine O-acetyltransferase [Peribacillus sp. SCS-26]|uniref:serine O-acetyltransferase n=1 Tax=Paraperibacillus marinus TaxID=3115295 RepID=UPI0039058236